MLRGPSPEAIRTGVLSADDIEAWRAMSDILQSGRAKQLGVANFSPRLMDQLRNLDGSPPKVLQAKCHAHTAWGRQLRDYCRHYGIAFQAPSLLTSNREALERGSAVHRIAFSKRATVERVLLRFALQIGIVPIVGTSSAHHLRDDLEAFRLSLSSKEVVAIERAGIADNSKLAASLAAKRKKRDALASRASALSEDGGVRRRDQGRARHRRVSRDANRAPAGDRDD